MTTPVVDLFSRKVIGWSMQPRMTKDIILDTLLMAVWRCNPQKYVLVHCDQGNYYTSHEWQSFLKSYGLEGSMSCRGNCHGNAVAESFFQLVKRERIKKKSTEHGKKHAAIFLITTKGFITVSVDVVLAIRSHWQNMKTTIINGSEVSRLPVAIHTSSISVVMADDIFTIQRQRSARSRRC